ncbi:MAG: epoxyqueuosine reductase QueH [Endomicrobiaceae bacterium]|jgi:predicted adenine nucleotide alpha hydrolase (AANH) superfamily ATPase|nr:epoxyqueuosine reductase QueH [Endomicrobiaceae bacterium]MDD3729643.1 epoxyqueuosine reductase QueH [Endomicrobiaceae bacterium]MDD4165877.1 epoxyqueuosine reductase QueH [Endomicrobiaceae bacterium]
MDRVLLHTCCAPCSASAIPLLADKYKITTLWFNPNIFPEKEYLLRKQTWLSYSKLFDIETKEIEADWVGSEEKYGQLWLNKAIESDKGRCYYCYESRLEETARIAKKLSIYNFSTTLLSSPYQKHETIKKIAECLAEKYELNFIYIDPRKDFYAGVNSVKKIGLYSQRYCGCRISIR